MDQPTPVGLTPDQTTTLLVAAAAALPYERSLLEEQIVAAYLPLAAGIAGHYRGRGIDVDDLRQVANMALLNAIRRFDSARGSFHSFAAVTISGEVKKYFRDHGWMLRPPRSVQMLQVAIGQAAETQTRSGGASIGVDEMASALHVDRGAVLEAMAAGGCFTMASLDAPTPGDGRPLGDRVITDGDDLGFVDGWVDLRPAWDALDDDEKRLIALRFFDDLTQERIAGVLGCSQMQVSRRLRALLGKLRSSMDTADAA